MFFKATPAKMLKENLDEVNRHIVTYMTSLHQTQAHIDGLIARRNWLKASIVSGEFDMPEKSENIKLD